MIRTYNLDILFLIWLVISRTLDYGINNFILNVLNKLKGIDSDDFEKEVEGDGIERSCDTLIICILTSIYNGIYF